MVESVLVTFFLYCWCFFCGIVAFRIFFFVSNVWALESLGDFLSILFRFYFCGVFGKGWKKFSKKKSFKCYESIFYQLSELFIAIIITNIFSRWWSKSCSKARAIVHRIGIDSLIKSYCKTQKKIIKKKKDHHHQTVFCY